MPESLAPQDVSALVQERDRYRRYLARLEERAGEANPRAYRRLKAEYEEKLNAIGEELARHADAIRAALREAEGARAGLEARRLEKGDELDEARLRHEVGEYGDEKEWKAIERRLAKERQDLDEAVERQSREVASLTELLEHIEVAAVPGAPGQAPPEEATVAGQPPSHLEPAAASGAGRAAAEPDEMAAASRRLGLEFLESLELPEQEEEEAEQPEQEEPATPPLLGQRASGQTDTILCPRCAAPNDPAEWYCVECGEELPAG